MEGIENQLTALFNTAGKHFEVLTYDSYRTTTPEGKARNAAKLEILNDLLIALAPFKERIRKLSDYDI